MDNFTPAAATICPNLRICNPGQGAPKREDGRGKAQVLLLDLANDPDPDGIVADI